jgi:hypothetical protein
VRRLLTAKLAGIDAAKNVAELAEPWPAAV